MNMRKIVAVALLATFALASVVQGQSAPWSTAAFQSWRQGVTVSGRMGVPRIATAALPTCNAATLGMVALDTTTSTFKICDGTTFDEMGTAGGATTIAMNDDIAITFGTGTDASILYDTVMTPDSLKIGVGQDSRQLWIAEANDSQDYALGAQTNPSLCIHSAATTANQYGCLRHNGTNFEVFTGVGALNITSRLSHTQQAATIDGATTFAVSSNYVLLACTGAETINTITAGVAGMVIWVENSDTDCTIADDEDPTAANAIDLTGAANDVGAVSKVIELLYTGSHWRQVSESDN